MLATVTAVILLELNGIYCFRICYFSITMKREDLPMISFSFTLFKSFKGLDVFLLFLNI